MEVDTVYGGLLNNSQRELGLNQKAKSVSASTVFSEPYQLCQPPNNKIFEKYRYTLLENERL